MSQNIKLNNETKIDLTKLIDSKLLVQANSGGGKSWLIRRLLEQSHGKVQQIVIDPEGEFSSLREKFDYVLAGKDGDTPADPRSAALLARRLLELKVSAIIDIYELSNQDKRHFVRLFLEAMTNAPKELWPIRYSGCLVVIDEAHRFAPERGESEALGAVESITSLGRKRGICAILATQRISKLHKDAAAECNNKLIGRSSLDIDRKRAAEELGFTSKEETISLRTLAPGEFYAFGPAISDEVIKVKVGAVETTHKMTQQQKIGIIPPTAKIKALLPKLSDLPAEAKKEAQTTAELRQEVASLRRELTVAKRVPGAPTVKIERIEVPTVGKRALEGLIEAEKKGRVAVKSIKEYAGAVETAMSKLSVELAKIKTPAVFKAKFPKPVVMKQGDLLTAKITANIGTGEALAEVENLTNPEQRILNAIAWMESIGIIEPQQTAIAFLAGYSYGGGAFNNPRGALRTKGLVEYRGDNIVLTESGRQMAVVPETPLTEEELHKKVLEILPSPARKILEVILSVYPESISNEDLAERAGYAPNGGAYNNPRGRLRSLGLIEYQGNQVKAKEFLFI